jgi:hypothetical protein
LRGIKIAAQLDAPALGQYHHHCAWTFTDKSQHATSGLGALFATKRGAKKIVDFTTAEKVATGARRRGRS